MYKVLIVLPISDTTNITPITINATNTPVLDEVEETNKSDVVEASEE